MLCSKHMPRMPLRYEDGKKMRSSARAQRVRAVVLRYATIMSLRCHVARR